MDISKLTDEQLSEALAELRIKRDELTAQRDEVIVELGTLSIELLARQPPAQMGVELPPLSLYGGW